MDVQERLQEALELLDLEGWLSPYVNIKPGGENELCLERCPIDDCDGRFKTYVNTHKITWCCFKCGHGGDPIRLLAGISGRTPQSIYAELLNTVIPTKAGDLSTNLAEAFDAHLNAPAFSGIPEAKEVVCPGTPFTGLWTATVRGYLTNRGITQTDIDAYKLKASMALTTSKGNTVSGPFVVFPITMGNTVVSWQGRRITPVEPKYISAANIKEWLYPLNSKFFQLYKKNRIAVLCEGVFDALGFIRLGLPALCTFGKAMSGQQIKLLQELQPDEVVLAWDVDASKDMANAVNKVSHLFGRVSVLDIEHPFVDGKLDAGDSLAHPWIQRWIRTCFSIRFNTRSPDFFVWKMLKMS